MVLEALAIAVTLASQDASTQMVRNTAYARVETARGMAADPALETAVERKNAAGESKATILEIDASWIAGGQAALKAELTGSRCADRLRELIAGDALIVEAILMDRQGALVCASGPTSDYYQGDEPKWQKPVAEGKPVFVDEPAYDESSDTYAIQLSVPMPGAAGPSGALTLTLRLAGGTAH